MKSVIVSVLGVLASVNLVAGHYEGGKHSDLPEEVRAVVREKMAKHRKVIHPLEIKLRIATLERHEMWLAENPSMDALKAKTDEINDLRRQIDHAALDLKMEMHENLTDEQFAKWHRKFQKRRRNMGGKHKGHAPKHEKK